jgi:hypothetical protein
MKVNFNHCLVMSIEFTWVMFYVIFFFKNRQHSNRPNCCIAPVEKCYKVLMLWVKVSVCLISCDQSWWDIHAHRLIATILRNFLQLACVPHLRTKSDHQLAAQLQCFNTFIVFFGTVVFAFYKYLIDWRQITVTNIDSELHRYCFLCIHFFRSSYHIFAHMILLYIK